MPETPFCIDLQEREARVCDLKVSGNKLELLSLGKKDTDPSFFGTDNKQIIEKQGEIIAQLWSGSKIKKREVNIIIPDAMSYSQILTMPLLKEKELLSAIRYQSDEFIPMPIDETNLDLEILSENPATKKITVLIVAVAKKLAAQIEKTIEIAGLRPVSLENELSATGRLIKEQYGKEKRNEVLLLVNFGFSGSSLYLVDPQTSLILFTRSLKIGYNLFLKDVKVNLNIDESKCLEILRTIGFAKSGSYDVEAILLPVLKNLTDEITKFVIQSKEHFNLQVGKINVFNYDGRIALFNQKMGELLALPVSPFDLKSLVSPNPVVQSNLNDLSSFASVVGGSL